MFKSALGVIFLWTPHGPLVHPLGVHWPPSIILGLDHMFKSALDAIFPVDPLWTP